MRIYMKDMNYQIDCGMEGKEPNLAGYLVWLIKEIASVMKWRMRHHLCAAFGHRWVENGHPETETRYMTCARCGVSHKAHT